jgi:hypothetical protein
MWGDLEMTKRKIPKERKHWSCYPTETTSYGNHKYGIGVYRFDKNFRRIEFWLDYESAMPDEIKRYEIYLKKHGWRK